jgi:KEOPS complex subunit Cgi121
MTHILAGARGAVKDYEAILREARAWASERGGDLLLADAGVVFGREHLESAALHAERAKSTGMMASRSLAMETLRYLTGERQVADAIRVGGLRPGIGEIALVAFDVEENPRGIIDRLGWVCEDRVLEAAGKALSRIGISATEVATVPEEQSPELALERTALLDVGK